MFFLRYIGRILKTLGFLLFSWQFLSLKYQIKLDEHYVNEFVFSLTTSPLRMPLLPFVFQSLPDNVPIVLNLPLKFKNTQLYNEELIIDLSQKHKNLIINRIDTDLGPQTKLLGLRFASKELQDFLSTKNIIVIDDDTAYSHDIVRVYDKHYTLGQRNSIYTANLVFHSFPIHQGFSSYSITFAMLTDDLVQRCIEYSKLDGCRLHDDFSFSAAFQDFNFTIVKVSIDRKQYLYGYDEDALHFQSPNNIKSDICARSIWNLRQQCSVINA